MSADSTRLDGRVALLTGAAGGIGYATARLLSQRGAEVVVSDTSPLVRQRAAEIAATGVIHDVTSRDSTAQAVDLVLARHGRLDILVNGAGWDQPALFADTDPAVWAPIIDINYVGVLTCCHATLVALSETRGAIVSIASDLARIGGWGEAVYAGAKAAVVAFSKSLAREVARDGIRVNCVSPALTETPFLDRLGADPVGARIVEGGIRATPMRRAAAPEEVAEAIAFLASPAAGFITGQVLSVNGGVAM